MEVINDWEIYVYSYFSLVQKTVLDVYIKCWVVFCSAHEDNKDNPCLLGAQGLNMVNL